jgi:hypothetical protein
MGSAGCEPTSQWCRHPPALLPQSGPSFPSELGPILVRRLRRPGRGPRRARAGPSQSAGLASNPTGQAMMSRLCPFGNELSPAYQDRERNGVLRQWNTTLGPGLFRYSRFVQVTIGAALQENSLPVLHLKRATPPERNMIARRRWFGCRALKIPRRDSVGTRRVKVQRQSLHDRIDTGARWCAQIVSGAPTRERMGERKVTTPLRGH